MKKRSQGSKIRTTHSQALDEDATDPIEFTKGKEHFSPIKYHHFEVGPFAVKLHPRAGETWGDMSDRATRLLDDIFDAHYTHAMEKFFDRIEQTAEATSKRKESRS